MWQLSAIVIWVVTCDFQQCGFLTSVDSDEPVKPPFKLRNSKWCSVSSLTIKEYSSDLQRFWSDCAYAQAGPRLCWSHIPHCWKFHALVHIPFYAKFLLVTTHRNTLETKKKKTVTFQYLTCFNCWQLYILPKLNVSQYGSLAAGYIPIKTRRQRASLRFKPGILKRKVHEYTL